MRLHQRFLCCRISPPCCTRRSARRRQVNTEPRRRRGDARFALWVAPFCFLSHDLQTFASVLLLRNFDFCSQKFRLPSDKVALVEAGCQNEGVNVETATSGVGSHSISAGTLLTSGYSVRACVRACFRLCSSEQQALYPRRPETSTVSGHGVCVCVY